MSSEFAYAKDFREEGSLKIQILHLIGNTLLFNSLMRKIYIVLLHFLKF